MGLEVGSVASFEPILDLLPSPLLLVEPASSRVLFANRAARDLLGDELPLERLPGERFSGVHLDWPTPHGTRALVASGETLELAGGRITAVTLQDVTALAAAGRRERLLAEAGALLARSLDFGDTLTAIARIAVPGFADWCFVEMLQPDGSIERVLMEHADPAKRTFIEEADRRYPLDPDSPGGSPKVIRTGEPEFIPEIPDEFLAAVAIDDEHLRLLRAAGFKSAIVVPMRVRGAPIGDIAMVCAESGRRYTEEDLQIAQVLADRCALALENARLFTEMRDLEAEARRSRDELQGILGGVADSVTAQAPDGRLVYANDAAVKVLGYPSAEALINAPTAEIIGRFDMLADDGSPLPLDQLPGRKALQGEWPEPLTVRYRAVGEREIRWSRIKSTPVFDDAGEVRLAINVIEDITEIKRSEEAQRFLAEAGHALNASFDSEGTLAAVAELAVPRIADWCAVHLAVDDDIRRVAVAHANPARVAMAIEADERYPIERGSPTGVPAVVRTGRSELYSEITDEMLVAAARDEEHLALVRSLEMCSAMIVPMTVHERTLGTITLISAEGGRRFTHADLEVAEALALQAASAVENARLYRQRSAIAQTLQASLLPPLLPEIPGVEVAAAYHPAGEGHEVGGDFYDVFSLADDQWYAVVGDVCGKGAEAAAVTALARYTIRAAASRRRSPAGILRWLSDAMVRQDVSASAAGRFCTIACLHLDLSRTPIRITVACGGHPLPLVLRADGTVEELGQPGTLLGLVEHPSVEDRETDLAPGDAIVLYTDGLTEAGAPAHVLEPSELAGLLADAAGREAAAIVGHLAGAGLGPVTAPRDDVAILALRAL
jgi:PAS domain S-box-containing protein